MRFLLINYFTIENIQKYFGFKDQFIQKFSKIFRNLDTNLKIIEIKHFRDLNEYSYRNKQNYSTGIMKTLNNFKIIDIVIIGKLICIILHPKFKSN